MPDELLSHFTCMDVKDPFPIPNDSRSFGSHYLELVGRFPNNWFAEGKTGKRTSYAELSDRIRRLSSGLLRKGYTKGDTICIFSKNCTDFVSALIGCSLSHVVISPANPAYTGEELLHQLHFSESSSIILSSDLMPALESALENATAKETSLPLKEIIILDHTQESPSTISGIDVTPFESLVDKSDTLLEPETTLDPKTDAWILPFSSGTTGLPKGVVLTHYNMLANVKQFAVYENIFNPVQNDTVLGILPMYHIYGLIVFALSSPVQGANVVLLPGFEPVSFLETIEKFQISHVYIVPPLALFLAKDPRVPNYSFASVKFYTVHGVLNGQAIPLVYKLFKGKTEELYLRALTELKEINPCMQPSHITIDFDIACLPAFEDLFPIFSIKGYFFHLSQANWREVQDVGPKEVYGPEMKNRTLDLVSAAAPLSSDVAAETVKRLRLEAKSATTIRQAWGMTELSPIATVCRKDSAFGVDHFGHVGTVIPHTEAKIIDSENGKPVALEEEGELCIKGPQVMKEYFKNPEATVATINSEGWLLTGDVAKGNEKGEITITDRLKELIKTKGFQVAPAELEGIILSHPQVQDCCVFGVPHPSLGEAPFAAIVPKPGQNLSEKQIKEFVKTRVAPYKQIAGGVSMVDSIPKSASGKILRRLIRARFL